MKSIKDLDLKNKFVLIRADLNVPLDDKCQITDDNRIKQFVPTLKYVLEQGGRPIVMSHLGEGDEKPEETSLRPVVASICKTYGIDATLATGCLGQKVSEAAKNLEPGRTLVLENLRHNPGEKQNDPEFARQLALLADIYINDAFATAHRKHASIVGVPKHFQLKAAGLLMEKELAYYSKAMENPKRPLCVILGGAKVSSKLNALTNIVSIADKIIIGGAMANTFLGAQGLQLGRSLVERDLFSKALELMGKMSRRGCMLYLPVDLIVGTNPSSTGIARAVPVAEVPADMMALDIGPASSILFREAVQNAETVVWNGPMGACENEDYSKGTTDMIETLASAHAMTVVGGGDTDAAIHKMQLAHKFDYISTGGGAFLALMEGKGLPGVQALE